MLRMLGCESPAARPADVWPMELLQAVAERRNRDAQAWELVATKLEVTDGMDEAAHLLRCSNPEVVVLGRRATRTGLPPRVFVLLPKLEVVDLRDCEALTALPALEGLTGIQTLDLVGCKALTALPVLEGLTGLQTLDLRGCDALTALPTSLSALEARGCLVTRP